MYNKAPFFAICSILATVLTFTNPTDQPNTLFLISTSQCIFFFSFLNCDHNDHLIIKSWFGYGLHETKWSKENSCPTFFINNTHHEEERDWDEYSVKYWYHGHFINDGKFILFKCIVCIPRDTFHVYWFCSFWRLRRCVGTV